MVFGQQLCQLQNSNDQTPPQMRSCAQKKPDCWSPLPPFAPQNRQTSRLAQQRHVTNYLAQLLNPIYSSFLATFATFVFGCWFLTFFFNWPFFQPWTADVIGVSIAQVALSPPNGAWSSTKCAVQLATLELCVTVGT